MITHLTHVVQLSAPQNLLQAFEGMQSMEEMWNMWNMAAENNPEILRSATTLFGFVVGDLFAQRALRAGLAPTMTSKVRFKKRGGLLGRLWFNFLDRRVFPDDPAGLVAVMSRTTSFNAVFAPFFIAAFFALLKLLQGHPELMWVSVEVSCDFVFPLFVAEQFCGRAVCSRALCGSERSEGTLSLLFDFLLLL